MRRKTVTRQAALTVRQQLGLCACHHAPARPECQLKINEGCCQKTLDLLLPRTWLATVNQRVVPQSRTGLLEKGRLAWQLRNMTVHAGVPEL